MDFPRCNIAHSDWDVRMPPGPSPVDPKVEMLPQLYGEEGDTLDPTFPLTVSFHIELGRYVSWVKIDTIHVGQIKMWQSSLERKVDVVPSSLYK